MPTRRLERNKRCRLHPYHAELWLALALLKAQKNPRDPMLIEALKMAYFTAPNDARLMAVRLDTGNIIQRSRRSRRQGTCREATFASSVKTTRIEASRGFSL